MYLAISNKDGIKRIRNMVSSVGYEEFAAGLEPIRNGEVF